MRYYVMIDEKLNIAIEESNKVLFDLEEEQAFDDGIVSTKKIIKIVQRYTDTLIGVAYASFSKLFNNDEALIKCGAMMSIKNGDQRIAKIVVNSDMKVEYQRFSLVHELGHLMTGCHNLEDNDNYKLSAHIDQNVFSIPEEKYSQDEDLLHEQIANVFALNVLIPIKKLLAKMSKNYDIKDVAADFGVTEQAIISRIALG